jgi:hypothetical protein
VYIHIYIYGERSVSLSREKKRGREQDVCVTARSNGPQCKRMCLLEVSRFFGMIPLLIPILHWVCVLAMRIPISLAQKLIQVSQVQVSLALSAIYISMGTQPQHSLLSLRAYSLCPPYSTGRAETY